MARINVLPHAWAEIINCTNTGWGITSKVSVPLKIPQAIQWKTD